MKTNYSIETSLPAYRSELNEKQKQAFVILEKVKQGADCLLKLAELTGLPQSTVAGRVNDLKGEFLTYSGHVTYKNYKRKRITLINPGKQIELFA